MLVLGKRYSRNTRFKYIIAGIQRDDIQYNQKYNQNTQLLLFSAEKINAFFTVINYARLPNFRGCNSRRKSIKVG